MSGDRVELPRRFGTVADLDLERELGVHAPALECVHDSRGDPPEFPEGVSVVDVGASVNALVWARNGSLAAGCSDGNVLHVDVDGDVGRALPATGAVRALAWLPSGDLLAAGYEDGDARAWIVDAASAVLVGGEREHPVRAVAWCASAGVLALASGPTIELWEMPENQRIADVVAHDHDVTALAWSPDGDLLASASRDRTVALWRWGDTLVRDRVLGAHARTVYAIAWSNDGRLLASGGGDRVVRVWDAASGEPHAELHGHTAWVDTLAWSPLGPRLLASAGGDRRVRVWDVASEERFLVLDGHESTVLALAWSPDAGTRPWSPDAGTLATGSDDDTILLWDLPTARAAAGWSGHDDSAQEVVFSPDGRRLASSGRDGTVRVWVDAPGVPGTVFDGHERDRNPIVWSPDGSVLAACAGRSVRLWDVSDASTPRSLTGRTRALTLTAHAGDVRALAWSPDGRTLASAGSDGLVCCWAPLIGTPRIELASHTDWPSTIAWSPDSVHLAVAGSDSIRVWDAARGDHGPDLDTDDRAPSHLSWSPDGRRLASAGHDKTVRVWHVESGACEGTLAGHEFWIEAVAWSPDGRWIASGAADQRVIIWDVGTEPLREEPFRVLDDHTAWLSVLAWSADGRLLATGGRDTTVRVWDARTWKCVGAGQCASTVGALWFASDGRWLRVADDGYASDGRPVIYDFRVPRRRTRMRRS